MIIALDVGNTNIVAGCIDEKTLEFYAEERISTDMARTELEYATILTTMFSLHNIDKTKINGCIISSVVPPINRTLQSAIKMLLNIDSIIVGPGVKTELNIKMENPTQVGADLIVNAVAGLHLYGAPLIIIDMGTATTFSVLDENKNYTGGLIMPGVAVSLNALVDSTSQLPYVGLETPKKVIGKNTVESLKSGIMLSQAASIDGIVERIEEELGLDTKIVATGGMAESIVSLCKEEITLNKRLTLIGLALVYQKNIKNKK